MAATISQAELDALVARIGALEVQVATLTQPAEDAEPPTHPLTPLQHKGAMNGVLVRVADPEKKMTRENLRKLALYCEEVDGIANAGEKFRAKLETAFETRAGQKCAWEECLSRLQAE